MDLTRDETHRFREPAYRRLFGMVVGISIAIFEFEHAMHFHLLKDTPLAPAMPRTALAGPSMPRRTALGIGAPNLRPLLTKIARRWLRNRTAATLNTMDDRLLSDIGLRRADIHSYVAEIDVSATR